MSYILILQTICFTNKSSRKKLYLGHLEDYFHLHFPLLAWYRQSLVWHAIWQSSTHFPLHGPGPSSDSLDFSLFCLSPPFTCPSLLSFFLYLLCLYFSVQLIPKGFLCTLQYLWVLLKYSELNKFWNLLINYHLFSFTVSSQ